ncbi:acyl-CoA dehydrogenase family protein [Mycolicibacterium nivoides]|uniref:acyl-CoA dehydrogenase family protein n=1 Tax=Mycolicibacterium nivoides TaxID=2487344 RepID=UPI0008B222FA|nr:acyl-CoA dehydrogenase [Mycolicibacterium nivoides]SEP59963.1 Acyl-CoA dehydrogenase [Mycobacterium sp. 88mf]SFF04901.1 Acyl-CoA dehydrogenase [Mycobacterium sp. 455mf]
MTTLSADERATLASSVRAACTRLLPEHRLRAVAYEAPMADRGFDRALWQALCAQVGVAAIGIPESDQDDHRPAVAHAVIGHEMGRTLAPVPFLSSAVLATRLLTATGGAADVLDDMGSGMRTAAAGVPVRCGRVREDELPVAANHGGRWRLSGSISHVLGAASAQDIVVLAECEGQQQLYLVDRDQPGVSVAAQPVLDATRPMATVDLDAAAARHLAAHRPVEDIVEDSLRYTIAVLTAEQVGAAERVLEMAVEYARVRRQFDRPIGSFQVIKHRCADMLVELEMARSASLAAVEAIDAADPDASWLVSMAKAVCSETLRDAAHANLQIHGGIGFTWEHAAGLYVKRARTDEVLFGLPTAHWTVLTQSAAMIGMAS